MTTMAPPAPAAELPSKADAQQQQQQADDDDDFEEEEDEILAEEDDDEIDEEEEEDDEDDLEDDLEDDDDEGDVQPADVRPWTSLKSMPVATQTALVGTLKRLQAQKRTELTALIVGKNGVGKSSVVNTIFGDRIVNTPVSTIEPDATRQYSRVASDFTLSIINSPGLLQGDGVSDRAMTEISKCANGKPIDVVLYVERLDTYRTDDNDRAVLCALNETFGPSVWARTLCVLTHGAASSLPISDGSEGAANGNGSAAADGAAYARYVSSKVAQVEACLRKATGNASASFATSAVVECSARCRKNANNEGVLPDGTAFLPRIVDLMADVALKGKGPMVHAHGARRRGKKGKLWQKLLIPFICYGQYWLFKLYSKHLFEADSCKGDRYTLFSSTDQEKKSSERDDKEARERVSARAREDDERARRALEAKSSDSASAPSANAMEALAAKKKKALEESANNASTSSPPASTPAPEQPTATSTTLASAPVATSPPTAAAK